VRTSSPGWTVSPATSISVHHDAPRDLDRAVVAQQLVAPAASSAGIGASRSNWSRWPQQRQRAVADEVHRGLVAGQVERSTWSSSSSG
jgi:hypothetical protein